MNHRGVNEEGNDEFVLISIRVWRACPSKNTFIVKIVIKYYEYYVHVGFELSTFFPLSNFLQAGIQI